MLSTSLRSWAKFSGRSFTRMIPRLAGPKACSRVSRDTVPSLSSCSETETADGRSLSSAMEPIFLIQSVVVCVWVYIVADPRSLRQKHSAEDDTILMFRL
jgi:hypothetical protein